LIANLTGQDAGQINYSGAATDQLDYLLQVVPKTGDGAISHRVSELQLWYVIADCGRPLNMSDFS